MSTQITVTIDLERLATYAPQQTALSLLAEAAHDHRTGVPGHVWTDNLAHVGTVVKVEEVQ